MCSHLSTRVGAFLSGDCLAPSPRHCRIGMKSYRHVSKSRAQIIILDLELAESEIVRDVVFVQTCVYVHDVWTSAEGLLVYHSMLFERTNVVSRARLRT